jgi:hypothetical protein
MLSHDSLQHVLHDLGAASPEAATGTATRERAQA